MPTDKSEEIVEEHLTHTAEGGVPHKSADTKRVRFGSDSSAELQVQVREFELEHNDGQTEDDANLSETDLPGADLLLTDLSEPSMIEPIPGAPSSASTDASYGQHQLRDQAAYDIYERPVVGSRYRPSSRYVADPVINAPRFVDATPSIHQSPALIYGEMLPPAPLQRRNTWDGRRTELPPAYDDDAELYCDELPEDRSYESYGFDRPRAADDYVGGYTAVWPKGSVIAERTLARHQSLESWQPGPAPRNVPVILGPDGLWRYYLKPRGSDNPRAVAPPSKFVSNTLAAADAYGANSDNALRTIRAHRPMMRWLEPTTTRVYTRVYGPRLQVVTEDDPNIRY